MSRDAPSTALPSLAAIVQPPMEANCFDKLPFEVCDGCDGSSLVTSTTLTLCKTTQDIALSFESDKDVASFREVCQSTRNAVDADACSFWRRRFLMAFEKPPDWRPSGDRARDNRRYRNEYSHRQVVLKRGADFALGSRWSEQKCLRVILDMILGELPVEMRGGVYQRKVS